MKKTGREVGEKRNQSCGCSTFSMEKRDVRTKARIHSWTLLGKINSNIVDVGNTCIEAASKETELVYLYHF